MEKIIRNNTGVDIDPQLVTYIMTPRGQRNWEGELEFGFVDNLLCVFKNKTTLKEAAIKHILSYSISKTSFLGEFENNKRVRVRLLDRDLSFEAFWNAYKYKVGKEQAKKAWKSLSEKDKDLALRKIRPFRNYSIHSNISMPYPATYLNKKRFLDELYIG